MVAFHFKSGKNKIETMLEPLMLAIPHSVSTDSGLAHNPI